MTTVSWNEIDTNHNGYVDGNEASNAKQKGVKNVWDFMTQNDYNNGITREQKLNRLYNEKNEKKTDPYGIYIGGENQCDIFIGTFEKADFRYEKYNCENNVLKLGIELNQIKTLETKLKNLEKQISNEYPKWKKVVNAGLTLIHCDVDYFKPSAKVVKAMEEYEETLNQLNSLKSKAYELREGIQKAKSSVDTAENGIAQARLDTPTKERISKCKAEINKIKTQIDQYNKKKVSQMSVKDYEKYCDLKFNLEEKQKELEKLKDIQKWEIEQSK